MVDTSPQRPASMYGHDTKHYHIDDDDDNDDHDEIPPTHLYDHPDTRIIPHTHPDTSFVPISHHSEDAMPTTLHFDDD